VSALAITIVLNNRLVPISQRKHQYPHLAVAGAAAIGLLGMLSHNHAEDPDSLWKIVHDKCVPNLEQHADPAPCALVDLKEGVERGYVIFKDAFGDTQYLLIPTTRVTGIESPELLLPNAPNYFAAAWRARGYVEKAARQTLPRAAIGLAINSVLRRSQNQLHVHIDCIRVDVQAALQRDLPAIGDNWALLPEPLAGHTYRARRVLAENLDGADPFVLLADGVPGAHAAMGAQTLVVVGAQFANAKPGFVILDARADLGSGELIKGEELQDHSCAVARD
jgi:CDP-diacylglycerol pyrophosphatase